VRQKRQEKLEQELALLEAEFRETLIVALRSCAEGRWGLFDKNDKVDLPDHLRMRFYADSGAQTLDALAAEIAQIRLALGITEPFALQARLLENRGRKSENDLGESRLASLWLQELES
jgi:hypothetical protein